MDNIRQIDGNISIMIVEMVNYSRVQEYLRPRKMGYMMLNFSAISKYF